MNLYIALFHVIRFFSIVILSILGNKMNKLYLAMLCIVFGKGSICADKIDYAHIKLKGNERIILCQDQAGTTNSAVVVAHKIDRELVSRALQPTNNVYDFRELQRSLPLFTRYKGALGLATGLIMGAVGLELFYFARKPQGFKPGDELRVE